MILLRKINVRCRELKDEKSARKRWYYRRGGHTVSVGRKKSYLIDLRRRRLVCGIKDVFTFRKILPFDALAGDGKNGKQEERSWKMGLLPRGRRFLGGKWNWIFFSDCTRRTSTLATTMLLISYWAISTFVSVSNFFFCQQIACYRILPRVGNCLKKSMAQLLL